MALAVVVTPSDELAQGARRRAGRGWMADHEVRGGCEGSSRTRRRASPRGPSWMWRASCVCTLRRRFTPWSSSSTAKPPRSRRPSRRRRAPGRRRSGAGARVGSSGRAILAGSTSLLAERRMDYLLGHSPIRIIPPSQSDVRSSGAKSRRPKKPETSSSRESKSPT
jgi:hypothetical protein